MSATPLAAPLKTLFAGAATPECRASVTIPVRNEEASLGACLAALASQVDLSGQPMDPLCFEVLLLCNNCTDRSVEVAHSWQAAHPSAQVHLAECALPAEQAHAGTARFLLMEAAWQRLQAREPHAAVEAILCTDADSTVAPDWLAQNLRALEHGADAVGGLIVLQPSELACLPGPVRLCYEQDRRYAALIARLEDRLDPQAGDPCPRHLDHFGSSLACTPQAYRRAGGMPAAPVLEDEAFVGRLRLADLRLRHDPAVRVYTSARLDGRATTGLAGQLRLWSTLAGPEAHQVQSATYLRHRFVTLRQLHEAFRRKDLTLLHRPWRARGMQALEQSNTAPEFLRELDCDKLILETFEGEQQEPIAAAIASLEAMLR